jgi:peptide/nickel transport system substrate-binding protein
VLNGQAVIANGPILPDTWAYYDQVEPVAFDADGARAALEKAGYTLGETGLENKDGVAVAFTLLHPDDAQHTAIAEAIQKNWSALGIQVTLEALPYDELVSSRLANRDFQAALAEINLSSTPDPDPYPFWDQAQSADGQNYGQWENRAASTYLEEARTSVDPATRTRLYQNFQVLFAQELPALPLFHPVYTYAVDASVQGVRMGPMFEPSDRYASVGAWFLPAKRQAEPTTAPLTETDKK